VVGEEFGFIEGSLVDGEFSDDNTATVLIYSRPVGEEFEPGTVEGYEVVETIVLDGEEGSPTEFSVPTEPGMEYLVVVSTDGGEEGPDDEDVLSVSFIMEVFEPTPIAIGVPLTESTSSGSVPPGITELLPSATIDDEEVSPSDFPDAIFYSFGGESGTTLETSVPCDTDDAIANNSVTVLVYCRALDGGFAPGSAEGYEVAAAAELDCDEGDESSSLTYEPSVDEECLAIVSGTVIGEEDDGDDTFSV